MRGSRGLAPLGGLPLWGREGVTLIKFHCVQTECISLTERTKEETEYEMPGSNYAGDLRNYEDDAGTIETHGTGGRS